MGRRYGSDDRKLVRYYQKSKRQKTSLHYDRLCVVRRFHRDGVFNFDIPVGLKTVYFILANGFLLDRADVLVIPHISLGSELTDDFNEKNQAA